MTGPIARSWLGIMVVHELNILYGEACCAKCCAPCGVLEEMAGSGIINFYVRSAPEHLYKDAYWWVPGGSVDTEWLERQISGETLRCH